MIFIQPILAIGIIPTMLLYALISSAIGGGTAAISQWGQRTMTKEQLDAAKAAKAKDRRAIEQAEAKEKGKQKRLMARATEDRQRMAIEQRMGQSSQMAMQVGLSALNRPGIVDAGGATGLEQQMSGLMPQDQQALIAKSMQPATTIAGIMRRAGVDVPMLPGMDAL